MPARGARAALLLVVSVLLLCQRGLQRGAGGVLRGRQLLLRLARGASRNAQHLLWHRGPRLAHAQRAGGVERARAGAAQPALAARRLKGVERLQPLVICSEGQITGKGVAGAATAAVRRRRGRAAAGSGDHGGGQGGAAEDGGEQLLRGLGAALRDEGARGLGGCACVLRSGPQALQGACEGALLLQLRL